MTNPIDDRLRHKPHPKGPVTVDQLHALAANLNRANFVQAFGWHYFVGVRDKVSLGGEVTKEHFLDRNERSIGGA